MIVLAQLFLIAAENKAVGLWPTPTAFTSFVVSLHPETEVVIPRLETDLVGLCIAASNKELHLANIRVDTRAAATIMAVSGGYPGFFEKAFEITGLDGNYGKQSFVFQAGTKEHDGKIVTNGGRVCSVTSYGSTIEEAVNTSLDILNYISFDGMYYRSDIGYEFIPPIPKGTYKKS